MTAPGTGKIRLRGVLTFHSETGTEGGFWAFQDERFITKNTTHFACTKCHHYWDKEKDPEGPPAFDDSDSRYCAPLEHTFELISDENWSYDGLHILHNGDELTIFSKDDSSVVWSGTIELTTFTSFTEHADGWWIHSDQNGVPRHIWATWFFQEYPAFLTPAK
ncbi:MAG: hypothetical protein UY70_C0008G0018 [Candidatus Kaiserbacteria bacterium GW2011_GWB1_52_6]|uniref:Uncharacterized protein n=3 Tax=Candidatus Kaiseribacteriota TaxID=1752734 RepID=A0A0G2ACI0_9BACT|nr:MAG: hypothetical protein UY67_C0031G0018 [Candidatus Kaiserbacteria bacterium GW2011_GWA2_52_12]KKW27739.1 MAG: hypothetical protein UY70_C0008G0018 [Candidatus Kaiserbacteria bacterium GW2011_GWB1_52_6]KKW30114.1 MAG: hypothetical protein UY74_C0051G0002 [Candidatus Kaiserbacteria bacterium GW2011_GWC2_52_8b]